MGGVPHHQAKARRHRDAHHRRRHAQQNAQPLFPEGKLQLLELFVQVMALFVDQCALFFEERIAPSSRLAPPNAKATAAGSNATPSPSRRYSDASFSSDTPAPKLKFCAIETDGGLTGNLGMISDGIGAHFRVLGGCASLLGVLV